MKKLLLVLCVSIVGVLIVIGAFFVIHGREQADTAEVLTVSTLEKIVNDSKLSTFTSIYNGTVAVENEDDPEKIDYYVSYEAKVNAGIDFDQIKFDLDDTTKRILVTLPQVYITKINVDITSMDYIFNNNKLNTSSISEKAYKLCEMDAQTEAENNDIIFEMARQNAENVIRGLIEPFAKQLDSNYVLELVWEGEEE